MQLLATKVSRLGVSMQKIHNPSGFSPSTMISYSQTKDMKETYIPRLNMDLTLRIFLHSPNICRKSRLSPLSELVYAGFLACSPDSYISRCGHSLSAHVSLENTVIGSYRGVRATNQTGKKEWVLGCWQLMEGWSNHLHAFQTPSHSVATHLLLLPLSNPLACGVISTFIAHSQTSHSGSISSPTVLLLMSISDRV